LWEKGLKVMAGVPLLSGESLVGVLHVGRLDDRRFVPEDVELLQVVGERIAGAVQSRQLVIERGAAGLLERSLLPTKLPICQGLTFATRYVAAEHTVGGDWYDLFTLPSGQLWIVVGDVTGHGLQAAVVMGRIRSALRAYALVSDTPEHVLELVDRKVDWFEIRAFATIICAVLDPPYDTMTIAVAGHPPPLIAVPGQPVALVEVKPRPPVGTNIVDRPCRSTMLSLPEGSNVVFYTDGLVERKREPLDAGLERLRAAISPGPAERVAGEIMRRVIGGTEPIDDVALVVVHRTTEQP
jgi:serine phosphatase RsbU (regulator of sigma subunit)